MIRSPSHIQLDNGLQVLVLPLPEAPVATVWLWMETGTADETADNAGVAHFVEHLVFKGTERRGVGQVSADIEGLGGDLNAWTTWDHTVLHATVGAQYWREALDVLADMATGSVFDADELQRERQVVLDEIRSYDEDVGSVLLDALRAAMWPEHAYGKPILGTVDSVTALTREQVVAYWRDGYSAGRATLVVIGPVTVDEVHQVAREQLGDWQAGPPRASSSAAESPPPQVLRIAPNFASTDVVLGWRVPGVDHPDMPALVLLSAMLGQGAASVLGESLQLDLGLASGVWTDFEAAIHGGSFTLGFTPVDGQTLPAIEAAHEALEQVRRGVVAGSRVTRTRDALMAQFWFDAETVDGLASDLSWSHHRLGGFDKRAAYRRRLASVQPDEVIEVARRWLEPDQAIWAIADAAVSDADLATMHGTCTRARPKSRAKTGPQTHVFPNGARLVIHPDDGKVAAIRLSAIGGALTVGDRQAGITGAWADLVQAGAGAYDAVGFRRLLDQVAGSFAAMPGPNTTSLFTTFPASEIATLTELLGAVVTEPRFDADEWDRIRDELLEDLRTLSDRPDEVAYRALDALMWRDHPWRLPDEGTLASVARITPQAIATWHQRQFDPSRLVAGVAGGVDPEQVLDLIGPLLSELPAVAPLSPRTPPRALNRRRHLRRAGQHQAMVICAVHTPAHPDPQRRALELANTVLDASGGRLFMELRERRGLGYATWSEYAPGLDGGAMRVGVTCAPDRVREAEDALRHELQQLCQDGPTADELARSCRYLDGVIAMRMQRCSGRASHLALSALWNQSTDLAELSAERAAVTAEDVRQALQSITLDDPLTLVVRPE